MTVREWLEKLFGSSELDKELEPGNEPAKEEVKGNEVKEDKKIEKNVGKTKVEPEQKIEIEKEVKKEEPTVDIFEMGWLDEKTGSIDFNKVKNPDVVAALKVLTSRYDAERQARTIQDAISAELANYALTVKADTIKKMLDTSSVKIDEKGQVIGIKDAIENLKKDEPGMFKDKDKVSSPLNEGFNPVQVSTNTKLAGSLAEAALMDRELSGK